MERAKAVPTIRSYIAAWAVLVVLTVITVTTASLNLGALAIAASLLIASVKSAVVLFNFMHLRYEDRLIIKLLVPIVLGTLMIFIGLTYTDILYR